MFQSRWDTLLLLRGKRNEPQGTVQICFQIGVEAVQHPHEQLNILNHHRWGYLTVSFNPTLSDLLLGRLGLGLARVGWAILPAAAIPGGFFRASGIASQAQSHRQGARHVDIHVKCNAPRTLFEVDQLAPEFRIGKLGRELVGLLQPRWICASSWLWFS